MAKNANEIAPVSPNPVFPVGKIFFSPDFRRKNVGQGGENYARIMRRKFEAQCVAGNADSATRGDFASRLCLGTVRQGLSPFTPKRAADTRAESLGHYAQGARHDARRNATLRKAVTQRIMRRITAHHAQGSPPCSELSEKGGRHFCARSKCDTFVPSASRSERMQSRGGAKA